uniref:Uncharacterized protein n=1 Tax=Plectus sambesii TaxID=2011161 RepID=A0A914V4V4_9BILA
MSLFDEILDENRPPPTYDYPSADDNEENEDKCDETSKGEKDASNCGRNIISSSSAALFEADNGLKDRGDEDDLRVNDDLRTRLTQRSGVDSLARPRSTSRPSSREERPASAASSGDEGGRRPRSNGSSGSNGENGAPLLSKQVQRLAKLGVQLSKAPRLSAGAEIVDLSLPGEVPEKSEKSSALDRWFKSKFELKRKTTADRQQPAPISFNTNMAVKDASGATVIEKKVIVLKKSQGEQRQPMRGIEGHKMVKNELEAALARKRQAGLQQRKEWYEEDNPKSEAEESEEELTDEDDGEPDGADDRASATNELVDDEAVEENDGDEEDNDDDDYAPESTPRLAADEPTPKIKSAQSVTADSQPFCLRLDSEPDTLEINNDELDAVDATTEHSTIVYDNGESDISSANLVKKQISTADFFDDDEGDANLDGTEKQSPARPRFLRPTSPSAKEDASKQQSAGIAQAATEFPLIGCSTPARPSNSKQSNGMFVASHESLDNADSQAFMSVDLHLPESLSQWAADTSNDASLISNQPGDATNEEVTTSDADSVPSQLLGLCSGKFSTNTLTPAAASLHTARTNSVDSDLLRLCSGVFPDDDATQHASPSIHGTHPIAKTPMETSDTNDTNDELGNVSDASDVTMKE